MKKIGWTYAHFNILSSLHLEIYRAKIPGYIHVASVVGTYNVIFRFLTTLNDENKSRAISRFYKYKQ